MVSPSAGSAEILQKANSVNFAWMASEIDQKFLSLKNRVPSMRSNERAGIEGSITYFSECSRRWTVWGLPTSMSMNWLIASGLEGLRKSS